MLELLEQLFRQVRFYAQSERFDRSSVYAKSSKHTTMKFDRDAEDIIIRGLEESGHGFEVISEERPTGTPPPIPKLMILVKESIATPVSFTHVSSISDNTKFCSN